MPGDLPAACGREDQSSGLKSSFSISFWNVCTQWFCFFIEAMAFDGQRSVHAAPPWPFYVERAIWFFIRLGHIDFPVRPQAGPQEIVAQEICIFHALTGWDASIGCSDRACKGNIGGRDVFRRDLTRDPI